MLCAVALSSPALAQPKPSLPAERSLLIRVQDGAGDAVRRPTEQECLDFPSWAAGADCGRYTHAPVVRKQETPASFGLPGRNQPKGVQASKRATAVRALSEHERNAQAPKPLVPPAANLPVKSAPGKTPEERLHHMVGQLVLTGFSGRQTGDAGVADIAQALRDGKVSGVIVGSSNVASFPQLRQLLLSLASSASDSPAIIAIDQPGGPDTVLNEEKGFAFYNSASSVSSGTPYEAQLGYRVMAGELAALGMNLNIGPSEDSCRENGINLSALCYGKSPSRIAAFARAFNFGHHDRGVLTALRHVPFREGLSSSWKSERASSALLHLLIGGETSDALVIHVKATQPVALADIAFGLRQKKGRPQEGRRFGFDGAVIFELDMGPGGTPMRYGEAILRAFQDGADMVLIRDPSSLPADIHSLSLAAVREGVKSGRLKTARIMEAYGHVQTLKARLRTVPSRTRIAGLDR